MSKRNWQQVASAKINETFQRHNVRLTLGGEPTFVPLQPIGPEWNYSAVGPTKLGYAQAMAKALLAREMRGGVAFFSPGKSYPGEVNPRWAIRLLANRDGRPVVRRKTGTAAGSRSLGMFRRQVLAGLGLRSGWKAMGDTLHKSHRVWVLLLDDENGGWKSSHWPDEDLELTTAEGPAGLRLPFHRLASEVPRRALTLEWDGETASIFLPPFLQKPFLALLQVLDASLGEAGIGAVAFQGYVPSDELGCWTHLGLAADPGVLEVNLPACATWDEYDFWIQAAARAAEASGLRSWKKPEGNLAEGTGGGNHLLWGGPTLDENPFFSRPAWLASVLRYWQRHPALAYLFTGVYVGASSQAPRTDESARDAYDLEMAWSFLENLGAGDHRGVISETLRHLQTDVTGNSHRSEISFDKFWNPGWPAGTLGLIEFRAIESLPKASWMSAVALLWTSLAAWLLENPCRGPLARLEEELHDRFFLPGFLWDDLVEILGDLRGAGYDLSEELFRQIWNWKFPVLLAFEQDSSSLTVRRAHESWPLLCETPVDGGTTSRFVDTSMQRLEFAVNDAFAKSATLRIAGRPLALRRIADDRWVAGLRFRRTNLYPSLHPGIPPQMPLEVEIVRDGRAKVFRLGHGEAVFRNAGTRSVGRPGAPCKAGRKGDLTCDLRIR